MNDLFTYIIDDCYVVFFCVLIVVSFLVVNGRHYGKQIFALFITLIIIASLQVVCCSIENYLEAQTYYNPVRVLLSWVGYLAGPAFILAIVEIMIRREKKIYIWLAAVPEFVNIAVTSLCFFTNLVFYYDTENVFHPGVLCAVPRSIMAVYIVILAIVSIHYLRKRRWECIIPLLCAFFISISSLNTFLDLTPVDLNGVTISTSILAYFMYFTSLRHKAEVKEMNSSFSKTEQKITNEMLDQAMETLAYTIDAKDRYTRGHSFRVAKYSRQIAALHGMDEDKCREIYFAGLLHDIGKISISDTIINKAGELTAEEYELIKKHPVNGAKILEKMVNFPSLQDGAKYHHERYDGLGYPYGIKGDDIPEMARIIAVADAYDTMTSHRTYRESMDQAFVKQEIWKGMGTQFDPHFAKIMISLIDSDAKYDMREKPGVRDDILYDGSDDEVTWPVPTPQRKNALNSIFPEKNYKSFGEFVLNDSTWAEPTESVLVTENGAMVEFTSRAITGETYLWYSPTIFVYHSKDGKLAGPNYEELAVFMTAGHSWQTKPALRAKSKFKKTENFGNWDKWLACNKMGMQYKTEVRKEGSMVYITLINDLLVADCYLRLPEDYTKTVFLSISGEYCEISNVEINL